MIGKNNTIKFLIFVILLIIQLLLLDRIITPSHNYAENVEYKLSILDKKRFDIDAFFIGKSHMEYGVSPMRIYENRGVVTYNLATGAQPILGSKYLVQEIFNKGYKPKVIIIDASSLFNSISDAEVRYISDNVMFNRNRMKFISDYLYTYKDIVSDRRTIQDYISLEFPIFQYHDRWDKLEEDNFELFRNNKYFLQGYTLVSNWKPCSGSISKNDLMYEQVKQNQIKKEIKSYGQNEAETVKDDDLYSTEIDEVKRDILVELRSICEINNCELIMIKVPVMDSPNAYTGAWTYERYQKTREVAQSIGIRYVDLLYDIELSIDWNHDSSDGGRHLNLLGAEKVSDFLSEFLVNDCKIGKRDEKIYDQMLKQYEEYCEIAHIELASNLMDYIKKIRESNLHYLIIISAKDDITTQLKDVEKKALSELGLKTIFDDMNYNDSYIAIVGNGQVLYEGTSNRQLTINSDVNGNKIFVQSAGYLDGNTSSITINESECSINQRGFNIVLFDLDSNLILDRSTCDTVGENHELVHDIGHLLFMYEEYLLGKR